MRPDAVCPNNWVSFHADGTVVLYPMQAPNRRAERRTDALALVQAQLGFRQQRLVDLTHWEARGRFLEGTGSLVLDHVQRLAFACRSPRTDAEVLDEWCHELGYEPVLFDAVDDAGRALYHTNVLMWIGARIAAVGAESIVPADRARVLARLAAAERDVVDLPAKAIARFAGNMLELRGVRDSKERSVLAMSRAAHTALDAKTRAQLACGVDEQVIADIPTIEAIGGGSVRCMLAEVPLP